MEAFQADMDAFDAQVAWYRAYFTAAERFLPTECYSTFCTLEGTSTPLSPSDRGKLRSPI